MVDESPNEPWANWAGNQTLTPYRHCHPRSLQDLVTVVQEAELNGMRVRAVGSSWSFTDIAMTADYLVETNELNNVLTTVLSSALNASAAGRQLVHVEAGIKVRDLCNYLDTQGLALTTMGGSDGQSLAGILSTSVHGPDFDLGPVPDMVRAVHIVGPGGVEHWIEPAAGITDPSALQQVLGIDPTNIHYNDDWFNSVIVSVGTLGIIYSVIIEVRIQYDLVETISTDTWPAIRAQLASGTLFQRPNRCVQVAIDPAAPHGCYLYTRREDVATEPASYELFHDPLGLFCTTAIADAIVAVPLGAAVFLAAAKPFIHLLPPAFEPVFSALAAIGGAVTALQVAPLVGLLKFIPGALGDVVAAALNGNPGLTAQVVTFLTGSSIPVGTRWGFAHTIMSGPSPSQCVARGLALEMAFDATNGSHLSFMDEALPLLDQWFVNEGFALPGWFSLRFVGRSRAYLAPQNRCDRTCMIEITGLRGFDSTAPILDRLEALGRRHGGIQHWGMFRNLSNADVARAYPRLEAWRRVRWQLTSKGTLRTFDNDFSVRTGLSIPPGTGLSSPGDDISYLVPLLS